MIQIQNIPPIRKISSVFNSSYLLDFEGNVWSFGHNSYGQLGNGEKTDRKVPTKIESLKDIQQISYGCGYHFLVKDSHNKIFVFGSNREEQLATEKPESLPIKNHPCPFVRFTSITICLLSVKENEYCW